MIACKTTPSVGVGGERKSSQKGVMEMVAPESMMTRKQLESFQEKGRFQERGPLLWGQWNGEQKFVVLMQKFVVPTPSHQLF